MERGGLEGRAGVVADRGLVWVGILGEEVSDEEEVSGGAGELEGSISWFVRGGGRGFFHGGGAVGVKKLPG